MAWKRLHVVGQLDGVEPAFVGLAGREEVVHPAALAVRAPAVLVGVGPPAELLAVVSYHEYLAG